MADSICVLNDILNFDNINITRRKISDNYQKHMHNFFEIEYIISGSCTYLINGEEYIAKPGMLFFITPIDFHEVKTNSSFEIINIIFSSKWISRSRFNTLFQPTVIENYDFNSIELLEREFKTTDNYNTLYIQNIMDCILGDLSRHIKLKNKQIMYSQPIQRALSYIHKNYRENITLNMVSKEAGFTPNYFSKVFSDTIGKTFVSFLSDLRLEHASVMLYTSTLSIEEIASQNGFKTSSHFRFCFKNKFGISPHKFRKNHIREK